RSCYLVSTLLLSHRTVDPRHLHSFPTRRSSDLTPRKPPCQEQHAEAHRGPGERQNVVLQPVAALPAGGRAGRQHANRQGQRADRDRKSTRLNSSHGSISYAVFCLKKKNKTYTDA